MSTWSEEQARTLLGLIGATTIHRDRERLFGAIADSVATIFPCDALAIVLDGPGVDQISPFVVKPTVPLPPLRRSESALYELFATGRVVYVPDREAVAHKPQSRQVLERLGVESYIAFPLIVRERLIGALVIHHKQPHAYDNLDRAYAAEAALIVATALDGCLLHEELERTRARLRADNQVLRHELGDVRGVDRLIGDSKRMREVVRLVQLVAPTDANVLIQGETGTGKELVARAVHETSSRADRPLVTLNCAAIPAGLIEAELFGHEEGAFTDAAKRRKGRFEAAQGGTLFLDEIGELPIDAQAKLLRVLQHRELERVGGSETIAIDVRIIAATNRDLLAMATAAEFRHDLYYRLAVFPIPVAPLRDRRDDIPALVRRFVIDSAYRLGKRPPTVDERGLALLLDYDWPGNVRELQNVIERAVILSFGARLEIELILGEASNEERVEPAEDLGARIEAALAASGGIIEGPTGAAARLGVAPSTLRSRMKKLAIK
jgi:formate hydrogenlyase transcriptional activator